MVIMPFFVWKQPYHTHIIVPSRAFYVSIHVWRGPSRKSFISNVGLFGLYFTVLSICFVCFDRVAVSSHTTGPIRFSNVWKLCKTCAFY